MNEFECDNNEQIEDRHKTVKSILAGASAGIAEHTVMFPFDTIKTRMQAIMRPDTMYKSVYDAFKQIIRTEGIFKLYRGINALVLGAIPSHGLYFATYEFFKHKFHTDKKEGYHFLSTGLSGSLATCAHDAIVTPSDVIKQRLQLRNSECMSFFECISYLIKNEGFSIFYRSYFTTLLMNIPFQSCYFITYETTKKFLLDKYHNSSNPIYAHAFSGGLAGGLAGAISCPFDVIKTRIQTQGGPVSGQYKGFLGTLKLLYRHEGFSVFFRGMRPKVLFHIPSAAICWTTYESVKTSLNLFFNKNVNK